MKTAKGWLPWILPGIVLLLGVLLSLWLQTHNRDGVFFSGDAGLKALLAQQFSSGQWQVALEMPQPEWVRTVWRQGLYPFTPPYAYEQQGNYFITFPFTFPALTAPFHAVFGYQGLYVVPLVSLWVIWWRICRVCQVWQVRSVIIALSLLVVMASPLTLYGAMYWEHTLAVSLAFWGLSELILHALPERQTNRISLNQALVGGGCVGLSVWFRPEFLCLVVLLGGATLLSLGATLRPTVLPERFQAALLRWLPFSPSGAFLGAMTLTVLGFFGLNLVTYGHALGAHGIQIVEESSLGQQLRQVGANYGQLGLSLVRYFPAIWLGLGLPLFLRGRARTTAIVLLLLGVLFAIAVPIIVPPGAGGKQWGPRFYLILMPMVGLSIATGLQSLWQTKRGVQRSLAVVALVFVLGVHANIINGGVKDYRDTQTNSTSLRSNYAPIAPALTALASYDEPWVAMSYQYVAQQLWPSVRHKTFFLTETDEAVEQLATELLNQGEISFLYICYPERPCSTPNQGTLKVDYPDNDGANNSAEMNLDFQSLGTFGKYPFYRVLIHTDP